MRSLRNTLVFTALGCALMIPLSARLGAALRSPENQVFQFAFTDTSEPWPDGSVQRGTLYLWIPEEAKRLRGLVILGANVPEHMLVGHEAIRRACGENDLGLVWAVPSFWRFGKIAPKPGADPVEVKTLPNSDVRQVEFLEKLLRGLAAKTGVEEIARVPWLPMGESGHLLMVMGLVNERPERCIAAICVKNPQPPKNKTVPMLWTLGTGQEWGQMKVDIRAHWKNTGNYPQWVKDRAANDWPLSVIVEPGTGHFYCSDEMADYFGRYISAMVRLRLSADSQNLLPLAADTGVLAHLPLPGQTDLATVPRAGQAGESSERAWFPNEELARAAQQLSSANWDAAPQMLDFTAVQGGRTESFALNSVTRLYIAGDGTVEVRAKSLDQIPVGFVAAGAPLAVAKNEPTVEWICGPLAPLGDGKFRIALDRTWKKGATYLIGRREGDQDTRRIVQPLHVTIEENKEGADQQITFEPIADVPAGTKRVALRAKSSAKLPVEFYVVAGPAVVRDGALELTPVPVLAKLPVEVTVAAWQWGRRSDPKVKTAPIVERTFRIIAP